MSDTRGLLRVRQEGGPAASEVKSVELFFDLVFVFAITQISHALLAHLDLVGVLQATLLLIAVWWAWVYTAWATNWLDPDKTAVRLLLFALMFAGLVMSASLPKAFEDRALTFALAYVCLQVGRCLFMLWVLKGPRPSNYRNFQRITAWQMLGGVLWIGGAFLDPTMRLWVWGVAMLVEFMSPAIAFWVPGLGRSSTTDWDVSGDHMAERCGLFMIIALGESILVTGATFATLKWDISVVAAFISTVVGSIAMWWIYFHIGAERARHMAGHSADPGRIARLAYTYVHILLVAGVIVSAVADESILKHPHGASDAKTVAVVVGGPALFLAGNLIFKWITAGWPPLSHVGGCAMLAGLALAGGAFSPLGLGIGTAIVLVIVAIWEARSLGGFDAGKLEGHA